MTKEEPFGDLGKGSLFFGNLRRNKEDVYGGPRVSLGLLKMDRILRHGGYSIIRESTFFVDAVATIGKCMQWICRKDKTECGIDEEKVNMPDKSYDIHSTKVRDEWVGSGLRRYSNWACTQKYPKKDHSTPLKTHIFKLSIVTFHFRMHDHVEIKVSILCCI